MTCLNCNFRFKPGQRAFARHPTVEAPTAYWIKWSIFYFGGAAIIMVMIIAAIVGERADADGAVKPVIVRIPDVAESSQALIAEVKHGDSLVATVDHTSSSEKSYLGQIHGSLSNGHSYMASVGCARDTANCSPLREGERIAFAFLPKGDLDEYLAGATVLDGKRITVEASIRLKHSGKSTVYFIYE